MFKRKKNATVVSQEQKVVISIPSDVWSEILRHFSRKQLCSQIHLVNRQLYDLANSRHNVPTTHVIHNTFFITATRPFNFVNVFRSRQYNCVRVGQNRFGDYDSKDLETHQLRKMPIPEPYVRFRKVYIRRLLGESTLKFLRDAKESFVGSAIHYNMIDILDNKDMKNQMDYLLQNVFHKPSFISVNGRWRYLELKALTDGMPNCSKINFGHLGRISDEDAIRMLLDWLSSGKGARNLQSDIGKKHLILDSFPRRFILDMVQQFKEAFNVENRPFSDFVITFVASAEHIDYCLEGDHKFTLNKFSSNERLSFFKHRHFPGSKVPFGLVYRLWYRRVINEPEDLKMAIHLQNLVMWSGLGIDLYDFYDCSYPYSSVCFDSNAN